VPSLQRRTRGSAVAVVKAVEGVPAARMRLDERRREGRAHAGGRSRDTKPAGRSPVLAITPARCGAAAGKSRAGGGITLKLLIDERIVLPGANVLSVEYKGATNVATLTADGRIECVVRGGGARGRVGLGSMRGCPRFLAPHASRCKR